MNTNANKYIQFWVNCNLLDKTKTKCKFIVLLLIELNYEKIYEILTNNITIFKIQYKQENKDFHITNFSLMLIKFVS